MALNFGSRPAEPIPDAILEDFNADFFLVCFEPDAAGVINYDPTLIHKSVLSSRYPHVVEAWERKQREAKEQAERIEDNILALTSYQPNPNPVVLQRSQTEPGVACDQDLLPGMSEHWGELHKCATHKRSHGDYFICKGCRVTHYLQSDQGFDRRLIMAQGARVPVCEACVADIPDMLTKGHQQCVCDTKPSCYSCRELFLEKLAKARNDKHIDGSCGRCGRKGLVELVDNCLHCGRMRVYTIREEITAESLGLRGVVMQGIHKV